MVVAVANVEQAARWGQHPSWAGAEPAPEEVELMRRRLTSPVLTVRPVTGSDVLDTLLPVLAYAVRSAAAAGRAR